MSAELRSEIQYSWICHECHEQSDRTWTVAKTALDSMDHHDSTCHPPAGIAPGTWKDPTPYRHWNGNRFSAEQARVITEPLQYAPRLVPPVEDFPAQSAWEQRKAARIIADRAKNRAATNSDRLASAVAAGTEAVLEELAAVDEVEQGAHVIWNEVLDKHSQASCIHSWRDPVSKQWTGACVHCGYTKPSGTRRVTDQPQA